MKTNDLIIISTHTQFTASGSVHGPGHAVYDYIRRKGKECIFIQHSIDGQYPTIVQHYQNNHVNEWKPSWQWFRLPLPLKAFGELLIDIKIVKHFPQAWFIGLDPLNAAYGLLLKKIRKVQRVIFYTADYAERRFNNALLNLMYHRIDRWCIKRADAVWNVSSKITKRRAQQGVPASKNFFVPNAPAFQAIKRLPFESINRNRIVVVSNLIPAINYPLIVRAIQRLVPQNPNLELCIIGDGPLKKELELSVVKMHLEKNIKFFGRLDHSEVINIMTHASIGLAPYTKECSWTVYGDSKKAREYLACGLPVIITDVVSTADDIKQANAGIVIALEEESLVQALQQLLHNDSVYQRMRNNAVRLAEQFDLEKILDEHLL